MKHEEVRLSDLYQEVILDHNRSPRNFGKLADANCLAHGKNPLCGDDYFLYVSLDKEGIIQKVGFEGSGCAISKASGSMMTTLVLKKSVREAQALKDDFIHLLTDSVVSKETLSGVGKLKIFEGVRQFPIRVKCAALIWRTLEAALKNEDDKKEVSTE